MASPASNVNIFVDKVKTMSLTFPCRIAAVALLWSLLLQIPLHSQETAGLGPLEPSDTSNPTATLNSLVDSCNELSRLIDAGAMSEEREDEVLPTVERILDCLDLSELPKELRLTAGIESALFLKEVLDRVELPAVEDIPPNSDFESSDENQPLVQWLIPLTRISIGRVTEGPRQNAFLFTPDTVRRAAQFYRIVNELPYRTDGPVVSAGLYERYEAATKKKPSLTADTSSPRGTLTLFIDSCNELNEEIGNDQYLDRSSPQFQQLGTRIISCLDSSQLPQAAREYFDAEAAVSLKEILDRTQLPNAEEIPGIESVETVDGAESLTRWQVPRTQIVISKIIEGPRRGEFLFSADTVSRAPEMYRKMASEPYRKDGRPVSEGFYDWWLSRPGNPTVASWIDRLPDWFQNRCFGMAIWQWVGLLIMTPLGMALMLFAFRFARGQGEPIQSRKLAWHWLGLIFPIIAILIPPGFKYVAFDFLSLRGTAIYIVSFFANVVFLLALMVLIVRVSSRIAESLVALPRIAPEGLDANLIRIFCRVLGIVAAVIVLLEGGRYLGFPITTLIASAGIGGLAIALSAQGLIKGLFGTVTILLDKPFRVGDRIIVKGHEGFVEEIGLRSTKIRAFDKRLIAIPNDLIAEAEIQNVGNLDFIRKETNLRIPLDTPREQVEKAVACIRAVLDNTEGMAEQRPPRVNFTEFNADSFNIRVTFCYETRKMSEFRNVSEKINLEIMRAFEEHGIQFSLPFRHSFWKTDDEQGPMDVIVMNER